MSVLVCCFLFFFNSRKSKVIVSRVGAWLLGVVAGRCDRGPKESSRGHGCVSCLGHSDGLRDLHV